MLLRSFKPCFVCVPVYLLKDRVQACPGYLPGLSGLFTRAEGAAPETEHHRRPCPRLPVV